MGRTMDFRHDLSSNLWALPRGLHYSYPDGHLEWTSAHGSVLAACFDMMTADGVNDAGLAGHLLWLAEADYGQRDPERPALPLSMWLQYFLDNFANVADAVAWLEQTRPQVAPIVNPMNGEVPTLHLALNDASGDSAIVEYSGGEPHVWHSRDHIVMTNSPPFDMQLEILTRVQGFGGEAPLPGTNGPEDRFARASYYLSRLPEPSSTVEAVAGIRSVMHNVAQPFRVPDPDKPYASQTLWTSIIDLKNKLYVFESSTRPNLVWVRLDSLDLSEGAPTLKLDLVGDTSLEHGLAGDVTDQFTDQGALNTLMQ